MMHGVGYRKLDAPFSSGWQKKKRLKSKNCTTWASRVDARSTSLYCNQRGQIQSGGCGKKKKKIDLCRYWHSMDRISCSSEICTSLSGRCLLEFPYSASKIWEFTELLRQRHPGVEEVSVRKRCFIEINFCKGKKKKSLLCFLKRKNSKVIQ